MNMRSLANFELFEDGSSLLKRKTVGTRSIIGADDRTWVRDTRVDPWRKICCLEIRAFNGQTTIGTGWLAGPSTVITAGHCVNNAAVGGWVREIIVSPGRSQTSNSSHHRVTANRFQCLARWVSRRDKNFDMGVIHLPQPLGDHFGWFGFMAPSDATLNGAKVTSAGYPIDQGGTQMVTHSGRVLAATTNRIFYDIDTEVGQSGAPVFIGSEDPKVVGVHAYGTASTPPELGRPANSAPRITEEIFNQIHSWRALSTDAYRT